MRIKHTKMSTGERLPMLLADNGVIQGLGLPPGFFIFKSYLPAIIPHLPSALPVEGKKPVAQQKGHTL